MSSHRDSGYSRLVQPQSLSLPSFSLPMLIPLCFLEMLPLSLLSSYKGFEELVDAGVGDDTIKRDCALCHRNGFLTVKFCE